MVEVKNLREKVHDLYDKIRDELYLCRPDINVSGEDYNSALLFGVMTELNKGNQLIFGEYGGGKTTSAEILHSLFYGLPLDLVKRVAVRGDAQLTTEKVVGRPDYGALHEGKERVVWQHFVNVPGKIVDEFNRIPGANQSIVLNGVDRGDWDYLNDSVSTGDQALFATCNYTDEGNFDLIPPILDRFDVAVESRFPGVTNSNFIARDLWNDGHKVLSDPELTTRAVEILNSKGSYDEVQKGLEDITDEYRNGLEAKGFPVLRADELEQIRREIGEVGISNDAGAYFNMLIAELNVHPKYGQKRSIDNNGDTSHGLYLYNLFDGSGSRRSDRSILKYSKTLAWMLGEDEVNIDHMSTVAPYALWHKIKWTDKVSGDFVEDERVDPLKLHVTKSLLGRGSTRHRGVKTRFEEHGENYQKIMNAILEGNHAGAYTFAERFSEDGKGHPIFLDLAEELRYYIQNGDEDGDEDELQDTE
jgi:MoxR-like ATPase